MLGVTSQADVDAGKVAVLAPEGFTEHVVQENVYAGPAMTRRATYMYGTLLERWAARSTSVAVWAKRLRKVR